MDISSAALLASGTAVALTALFPYPAHMSYEPDINTRIWQVVSAIPAGKVSTYGEVANMAGLGRGARRVGAALKGLPADTAIPWHRVLNAQGRISLPTGSESHARQRERLEAEGVEFRLNGSIELEIFRWRG